MSSTFRGPHQRRLNSSSRSRSAPKSGAFRVYPYPATVDTMGNRRWLFTASAAGLVVVGLGAYLLLRRVPNEPAPRPPRLCPNQNAELVMTIPVHDERYIHGKRHELEMVIDGVARRCSFGEPKQKTDCAFTAGSGGGTLFALTVAGEPERASVRLLTDGVVRFEGESSTFPRVGCPPVLDVRMHSVGR